jgi:hypothetical protein
LSKTRIFYVALMVAAMAALFLVRVYAGDGNGDQHGIIHILSAL